MALDSILCHCTAARDRSLTRPPSRDSRSPYLIVVVASQQDEQRQRQGDVGTLRNVLLGQLPLRTPRATSLVCHPLLRSRDPPAFPTGYPRRQATPCDPSSASPKPATRATRTDFQMTRPLLPKLMSCSDTQKRWPSHGAPRPPKVRCLHRGPHALWRAGRSYGQEGKSSLSPRCALSQAQAHRDEWASLQDYA